MSRFRDASNRERVPDAEKEAAAEAAPDVRAPLTPSAVLVLQHAAGNRVVANLLQRGKERPRRRYERRAKLNSPFRRDRQFRSARLRERIGRSMGPQVPVVGEDGERLWTGARPGFRPSTYDDVLRDKGKPQQQVLPSGSTREVYQCRRCNQFFPRLRDAIGNEPTIDLDHVQDWDSYVTLNVDQVVFPGPDGHEWQAYLLNDVIEAYNDEANLVPLCSFHNRSKSGPKDIDRWQPPEHLDDCELCAAQRFADRGPDPDGDGGPPEATVY